MCLLDIFWNYPLYSKCLQIMSRDIAVAEMYPSKIHTHRDGIWRWGSSGCRRISSDHEGGAHMAGLVSLWDDTPEISLRLSLPVFLSNVWAHKLKAASQPQVRNRVPHLLFNYGKANRQQFLKRRPLPISADSSKSSAKWWGAQHFIWDSSVKSLSTVTFSLLVDFIAMPKLCIVHSHRTGGLKKIYRGMNPKSVETDLAPVSHRITWS